MLRTFGLTHLALRVPDVEHAYGFYESVFGMVAVPGEPYIFARDRDGSKR